MDQELGGFPVAEGSMGEQLRRVAQRNHSALLSGLAQVSQKRVADLVGISESALSEFKDRLERYAAIAAACGLKLVPITDRTLDDDYIQAVETIAAKHLRSGQRGRQESEL